MTTWTKPLPNDELWRVDFPNRFIRITEDGRLRVTEDGLHYRVIEHTQTTWTKPFPPPNPWH